MGNYVAVPDVLVQASAASLNVSDLLGYMACVFVLYLKMQNHP